MTIKYGPPPLTRGIVPNEIMGVLPAGSQYYVTRFVDPVNGDDGTGNGGVDNPFKTITHTLSTITDAADGKRYLIDCAPGLYNEGGVPVVWKPFVSLFGKGFDATLIPNGINYTAPPGEAGRIDWIGCRVDTACNVDCSAAVNTNLRLINFRSSMNWNGGPNYPNSQANNLLTHSCVFNDLHIIDGAAHLYDNMGIFSSLTIDDGPVAGPNGSLPFLEICGGLLQGTITLSGRASVYARGILNTATLNGTVVAGVTPLFETDDSSVPTGAITGTVKFLFDDHMIQHVTANVTVTSQETIEADATAGPISVFLPLAANYIGKPIKVKKVDTSANHVTFTPAGGDQIDGGANLPLTAYLEESEVVSDGTTWHAWKHLGVPQSVSYTPGNPNAWRGSPPNNVATALDRLASRFFGERGNPNIP